MLDALPPELRNQLDAALLKTPRDLRHDVLNDVLQRIARLPAGKPLTQALLAHFVGAARHKFDCADCGR